MTDLSQARWRKSHRSNDGGNCVEIADNMPGVVAVRDSNNPGGPVLVFTLTEWHAFVAGVKQGEFDGAGDAG
jgi:hypothetical protein